MGTAPTRTRDDLEFAEEAGTPDDQLDIDVDLDLVVVRHDWVLVLIPDYNEENERDHSITTSS
eukprot:scaffold9694_cov95-Skeletonema_dohrnii-CCMP3373.AAC.1